MTHAIQRDPLWRYDCAVQSAAQVGQLIQNQLEYLVSWFTRGCFQ